MGNYIKSNQFSGIVAAEVEKSIASAIKVPLTKELKNIANYSKICEGITKQNMTNAMKTSGYGGRGKSRRRRLTKKQKKKQIQRQRRTVKTSV